VCKKWPIAHAKLTQKTSKSPGSPQIDFGFVMKAESERAVLTPGFGSTNGKPESID